MQDVFGLTVKTPMTRLAGERSEDFGVKAELSLRLIVYFPTTTHMVKREYLLYTYDSFVADVGGYLGLLLGHR